MLTQTTVFIVLFSITGISLTITIGIWIYLLSLGTKINEIEHEIEKKAQEFDLLKKEHATISHPQPILTFSEDTVQEQHPASSMNNHIQIMRNVRGSFQTATDSPADFPSVPVPSEPLTSAPETQGENDILDVVADNSTTPLLNTTQAIALYSDLNKDADFNTLWQKMTELLSNGQKKCIPIDFSGINFLYDKELQYLYKISQIVSTQGSSICFVNCDTELITIMQRFPQLLPLLSVKET